MLATPEGVEYWEKDEKGRDVIVETAPDWAKEEFVDYQKQLDDSEKLDENNNLKSI